MKYNRYLLLILPITVLVFLEIFYKTPKLIFIILVLIYLLFFFVVRQFIIESGKNVKLFNIFILPAYFTTGIISFSLLLPDLSIVYLKPFGITLLNITLVRLFFLVNIVFIYRYFKDIYCYLVKTEKYRKFSLENYASYANFMAYYLIASSVYGFQAFLNTSVWILVLMMSLVSGIVSYQVMWANKIKFKVSIFFILILCLTLTELAWTISFLTTSYYILGLILAICYYILIGLTRFYLLGNLNKKIIKLYLVYGLSSLFIVLLTSRWI